MEKHLHIICHDVPYPTDYGGVVDLFYKLKYLHESGVKIYLHCYEYGRGEQQELLQYCQAVHYYKRSRGLDKLAAGLPYIVGSRADERLLQNLSGDHYPILLEGIHCTYLLHKNLLSDRKTILRLHNVEFEYYRQLSRTTSSLFHKLYYVTESVFLKRYEQRIASKASAIVAVSPKDVHTYTSLFNAKHIFHLPVFVPWTEVLSQEGRGTYCLYQGNLSVSENEQSAIWLIKNVFHDLTIPLIIAGKNPSPALKNAVQPHMHIHIVENPSQVHMQELIQDAQINLLPSFNTAGIKLKLLHAVFCGRHCIANSDMIAGTGVEGACYTATGAKDFQDGIQLFFDEPFTKNQVELRKALLRQYFNNRTHADQLTTYIWG